jgi:crossover junction endodeoxyribonuclease RuvC
MPPRAIRIIGVDPGLRRTGWGVIAAEGARRAFLACGVVESDEKRPLAERLRQLHDGLTEIMRLHRPDEAAIEETFVNRDAQATLKLGQARGVSLLVAALNDLAIAEYAPNQVKKTIVGAGHAEKAQIHAMVRVLLPDADPKTDDAADALAIALTHAQHRGVVDLAARIVTRARRA